MAQCLAEHGWYASIAGPLTYPANDSLREAVAALPDALLLVETDAPYLPPKRWRGRPNASYLLGDTVRFLAEQREIASDWWQDGADRGSGLPGVVPFPFAGDGLTA